LIQIFYNQYVQVGRFLRIESDSPWAQIKENIMKKNFASQSGLFNPRAFGAFVLCAAGAALAVLTFAQVPTPGPSPAGGTLSTANRRLTYMDPVGSSTNPSHLVLGKPDCSVPNSCSIYTLTIDPSVSTPATGYDPTQYQIFIDESWSPAINDYDTFVEDAAGNLIASNLSSGEPETITLPTATPPGVYKIILEMATGAPTPYTGTVTLQLKPTVTGICGSPADCTPPRYINYPAGTGQAESSGEPSIGIDWNPNVASLKNTTSPIFTTGTMRLNTGGVAFFKDSGGHNWRANFDDCPSPAVNVWEDVSSTFDQQFVLTDAIGFVDHYSSSPLGLAYPPPHTPGRVFTIDLIGGQGNSLGGFSDNDGNSYTPGGNGGPGQGPDHETLGGGPYNLNSTPPPPPQVVAYGSPNAIYYCSQNIVAEAQCSRSDNGGQSFGPGVPIFTPTQCTGGIHGHVKVAPDGTVYVPNSSCGAGGADGVAVSTDNGITWTENNVANSTGSQDPSVGIGQNNVGKPGTNLNGTNTIYLGWVSGDGHAHVAHSGNRGATWTGDTDVGAPFGVQHAVFPVVVAGDDNRAAFGFLGTGPAIATSGTCDPYGATLNCANIWHLYIATTYNGGANWITIDATPADPVQTGTVCLQGTLCAGGRNLLDFNDFTVDSQGRGLLGYADGCQNCNNTFQGQSSAAHGSIARQSGGRRLFAAFDPVEPTTPASPQMVSAVSQSSPSGALVTWLEPDNGGSPITGYNVYRGTTSGFENLLAQVSGETTTKYFDPSPPPGNVFYYARAINAIGEGNHCGEVMLTVGLPPESECITPGLTKLTDPAGDNHAVLGLVGPAPAGTDLLRFQIAQPYQPDGVIRLVFTITTDNGQSPQLTGSSWYVAMKVPVSADPSGYKAVHMTWKPATPATPTFESYTPGPNSGGGVDGRFVTAGSQKPAEPTSNYITPFNQVVIVVKASDLGLNPGDTISGFVSGVSQTTNPVTGPAVTELYDDMPDGLGYTGSYTVDNNQVCRPNAPPVAVLTANPLTGTAPLLVHFDASGSYDPDTAPPPDTITNYHFDFGDGSAVDQSTPTIDHTYNAGGDYPARLTVTESRGGLMSNNPAQVVIHVVAAGADLAVLKTGPSTGHVGQQITYTIKARNNGPQTANGVTLTDTLPKNTGFGSATSTQGSCAPTPHQQLVTCNIGTMNSGTTVTVTLVIKPTTKGNFTDTATVTATSPNDPVSGNNTSSVTTKVSP
jgi:uncharacterized repeat protein (TIGR01451 family)